MSQTLTVNLPSELYVLIKKRADEACRSVEDEAIELLAATVSCAEPLPADLQQSLALLEILDNASVERAARSRLAAELAAELEKLHLKQQREGLTEVERLRCSELVHGYERSMLIRCTPPPCSKNVASTFLIWSSSHEPGHVPRLYNITI